MFDGRDDAKAGYRRVEVLTGPGRRRRWSAEDKARIVAEAMASGAVVSEVARRWQISSQQVFGWRREARTGLLALPAGTPVAGPPVPDFVPIFAEPTVSPAVPAPAPVPEAASGSVVEVEVAGAVVRVSPGMDAALLTFPDGRFEIRHQGQALPYLVFDKGRQVQQGSVVANKNLGTAMTAIKAKQARRGTMIAGSLAALAPAAGAPLPDRLGPVLAYAQKLQGLQGQAGKKPHSATRRPSAARASSDISIGEKS